MLQWGDRGSRLPVGDRGSWLHCARWRVAATLRAIGFDMVSVRRADRSRRQPPGWHLAIVAGCIIIDLRIGIRREAFLCWKKSKECYPIGPETGMVL